MKKFKYKKIISHPQVAVVIVVIGIHEGKMRVLLYERDHEPFAGILSLPAGLIFEDESLDRAATRVLKEKTGVDKVFLEQLYTFGAPERDPHERTIGVAYYSLIDWQDVKVQEEGAGWYDLKKLEKLAFDHNKIAKTALNRIKSKVMYSNIAHGALPSEFTLTDLQQVYEAIIGQKFDKRNFRKKVLSLKILQDTGRKLTGKKARPAVLYKFTTTTTILFKSEI